MYMHTNGTFAAVNEAKMAYRKGIIAVASAVRSIGLDPRSWIIDEQVHALVQLPYARESVKTRDNRSRLFAIAAAAIS